MILRTFKPEDDYLSNQDFIERTGLPKATISRLTFTLVSLGYLIYDESSGRYRIGPATIALGYSGLSNHPVIMIAKPLMQKLADDTNTTVAVGIRDGMEMLYLMACRSMSLVTTRVSAGSRLPLWRSAMGLAYVAGADRPTQKAIVDQLLIMEPENASKILKLVNSAVSHYERNGFIVNFGHWFPHLNTVGASYEPLDGSATLSFTCGTITTIATEEVCQNTLGPSLVEMLKEIDRTLRS